jgi:hypothetical protein
MEECSSVKPGHKLVAVTEDGEVVAGRRRAEVVAQALYLCGEHGYFGDPTPPLVSLGYKVRDADAATMWSSMSDSERRKLLDTRADDGACPNDPDGQHHVSCGCDHEEVMSAWQR